MTVVMYLLRLLQAGLGNLTTYLTAPIVLCLLPAFFIGAALMTLIPKEAVTNYLGRETPKWLSYPAALAAGFVLAVCPCTLLPLFASIYKKGAGLGPAITFIFFAPASNLLVILFIGAQLGVAIALARIVLSMAFGIAIGLSMSWIFRKDDEVRATPANATRLFAQAVKIPNRIWGFLVLLVAVLMVGTLQVGFLKDSLTAFTLPAAWASPFQAWLNSIVPPNPPLGIEGPNVQGVCLMGLLVLIGVAGWKGLSKVDEGMNAWTYVALGLISLTLVVAALHVTAAADGLSVGLTGKLAAEVVLIPAIWYLAARKLERDEVQEWLWQMWRFVQQIILLLLVGIFLTGLIGAIIPASMIQAVAGRNTLLANIALVVIALILLPKLVEVPVAQMFFGLGMHPGPLLAYLVGHAELNLQSMANTSSVMGKKKMAVYLGLAAIFSILSGLIFGAFQR
jgi:uncharacterized protein